MALLIVGLVLAYLILGLATLAIVRWFWPNWSVTTPSAGLEPEEAALVVVFWPVAPLCGLFWAFAWCVRTVTDWAQYKSPHK